MTAQFWPAQFARLPNFLLNLECLGTAGQREAIINECNKPLEASMHNHAAETQVEYLERNIAEVRTQRSLLLNASWEKVQREDPALCRLEQRMTAELHEIRPYSVVTHGPAFIVAHKGMYVVDDTGENWLTFETAHQAQAWITEAMNEGREAAA